MTPIQIIQLVCDVLSIAGLLVIIVLVVKWMRIKP